MASPELLDWVANAEPVQAGVEASHRFAQLAVVAAEQDAARLAALAVAPAAISGRPEIMLSLSHQVLHRVAASAACCA